MSSGAEAPVLTPLPGWRDPLDVLPAFASDPMPVLLYGAGTPAAPPGVSRWSLLCAGPFDVVAWRAGDPGDPLRILSEAVRTHPTGPSGWGPFAGGAVGYVGYDVGRRIERVPETAAPGLDLPDMLMGLYSWALVWDHMERRWAVVSTGLPKGEDARRARALREADAVRERLEAPPQAAIRPRPTGPDAPRAGQLEDLVLDSSVPRERYLEMVARALRLIGEGELYQVNLSQRLELPEPADPIELFVRMARLSPAPFSAYLDGGAFQVLSASPERFVKLEGRAVESRPIKGTRPRGGTPAADRSLREELSASGKDRAENVMIVDLVRSDLGRVCRPGSVRVADLYRAESYASVHHLVSVVVGEMESGLDASDLLRALFPPGSMTGAPKPRAMRAIEELEPHRRGPYAGALGYLSFCGTADLSVVIRTAVVSGGRTWLQVGGGVVADSDPQQEYRESLDKAASVLRALAGAALRGPAEVRGTRTARRRSAG